MKKKVGHGDARRFISRDLSWLDFNARVLEEAAAKATPLLERLKFIAIFSGNIDEFFMVRVASLLQTVRLGEDAPDPAGNSPSQELRLIRRKLELLIERRDSLLADILAELAGHGIRLGLPSNLPENARRELERTFDREIAPVLTPLAVDPSHPFPIVNNCAIEIAVGMLSGIRNEALRAFVRVPETLPRFLPVDDGLPGKAFVTLEELVMAHLGKLFNGCQILECFPFRVTRDMEFQVDDSAGIDLLADISAKLTERRQSRPVRLELADCAPPEWTAWLLDRFQLTEEYCYRPAGPLFLRQWDELIELVDSPELRDPPRPPLPVPELPGERPIFDEIAANGPLLIAPPYQSFDPVVRLLESAAEDPDVLAVKQTLYRVSGNSPVVRALQRAAENGKQVTAIVELKARFDEGNNIAWAKRLEESGAHVVYGIRNLKIHCKALLIVRREKDGIRRYLHLSTGNYNDRTALQYTDIGLVTVAPDLCADASTLFNVMTGYSEPPDRWEKISAAPFDFRETILEYIDREAARCAAGRPGKIIAKMNALSDPEVIEHLHQAAAAGVKIDLVVRGICCFKPLPGESVRVVSILDRYLEHARIFYFLNGGDEEFYLSSADWMPRNFDRRVELCFPVEEPRLRAVLRTMLELELADREKGRRLRADGKYSRCLPEKHLACRSQQRIYDYFADLWKKAQKKKRRTALEIFTAPGKKGI